MQDSMFNYSFQESIVICSFMEIDIVNIDRDARRCLASLRYFCIAIFKAQLDIWCKIYQVSSISYRIKVF